MRVATITTRTLLLLLAPYKGARFSSKFRLAHFTFIALNSAGFGLCASAALRLCASSRLCSFAPLLCSASPLCSSLLRFALLRLCLSALPLFCFVYASASFSSVPRLCRSLDAHDSNTCALPTHCTVQSVQCVHCTACTVQHEYCCIV